MSILSGHIDQKSSEKDAWKMWKMTEAVKTAPAIQCHVTHGNCTPTRGKNAVNNSVNMDAAMIQWNARATRECLGTFGGISDAARGGTSGANCRGFAKYRTYIA
jgi:hypothetical protein